MNVFLPPVYSIQELTPTNNLIRQIGVPATPREGQLANYTGDRVRGHILVSHGLPELLIVPARTRIAPGTISTSLPPILTLKRKCKTWPLQPGSDIHAYKQGTPHHATKSSRRLPALGCRHSPIGKKTSIKV